MSFNQIFKEKRALFEQYAELLIKKGANVQKGQGLAIDCPVECYEFGQLMVQKAYEHGSGHVELIYSDDVLRRLTFLNNDISFFENPAQWKTELYNHLGREGYAFIFLDGSNPMALKDIDPAKPAASQKANSERCKEFRKALDFNINQWNIAAVATKAWANKVFPNLTEDEALAKLWDLIFKIARADGSNPQDDWEEHKAAFDRRKRWLNEMQFSKLRYSNSKGTNLEVGLTDKHIWEGGGAFRQDKQVYFFPNMPTEEIFTSPDFRKVDGIVYSALPLALFGDVVDEFWFKFEAGKIVDYGAQKGKELLDKLLSIDEGARYLGECALVPKESPIKQSGVLFYSTLYDENASCHLATGKGFPECYEGGLEFTKEELADKGINDSLTHVDFMIGTDDLSITGISAEGKEYPIFVDGTWAEGL